MFIIIDKSVFSLPSYNFYANNILDTYNIMKMHFNSKIFYEKKKLNKQRFHVFKLIIDFYYCINESSVKLINWVKF